MKGTEYYLANFLQKAQSKTMNTGDVLYIVSNLATGALAVFFGIMLWSKTRDPVWMLMAVGTIFSYVETIYSLFSLFGLTGLQFSISSNVPMVKILLSNLRTGFFIAGFLVMIMRKFGRY
jgi:membrane protein YdbS with pleckstrin-like domain